MQIYLQKEILRCGHGIGNSLHKKTLGILSLKSQFVFECRRPRVTFVNGVEAAWKLVSDRMGLAAADGGDGQDGGDDSE